MRLGLRLLASVSFFAASASGAAIVASGTSWAASYPPTTLASGPVNAPPPPGMTTTGSNVNITASYGTPTSVTSSLTTSTTLTKSSGNASASINIPAGSLPANTTVSVYPVTNTAPLQSVLPSNNSYVVAFAVSWQSPDGTSPAAKSTIKMTVKDPGIRAGDAIYELTSTGLKIVGSATVDGSVTIFFENDPTFVVAVPPKVSLASSLGTIAAGAVELKMSCISKAKCVGNAKLVVARKLRHGKKTVVVYITVASAKYSIKPGVATTLNYGITTAGKAVLAKSSSFTRFRMSLVDFVTGGLRTVRPAFFS